MKYNVTLYYTASIDYEVEADSVAEAESKALSIEDPPETFAEKLAGNAEFTEVFVND